MGQVWAREASGFNLGNVQSRPLPWDRERALVGRERGDTSVGAAGTQCTRLDSLLQIHTQLRPSFLKLPAQIFPSASV